MQPLSPSGYAVRLLAVMTGVLAIAWVYVVLAPMAFLPSGYPSWMAKLTLLRECPAGAIDVFGNSRVEAGIIPAILGGTVNNIGVAGGSAIETAGGINRLLTCATKPDLIIIAVTADTFDVPGWGFWVESLGYGFIRKRDLLALERDADRIGDRTTLRATKTQDGMSGPVRDWLYALRFPSLSFASLIDGEIFRRYDSNIARYKQILRARGFVPYPPEPPTATPGPEAAMRAFSRTPLQTAWFEKTLETLRRDNIPVALLNMPIKQATHDVMAPGVTAAYLTYLRDVTARFPNVWLMNSEIPAWPNTLFTDAIHLAPQGAERFSQRLAVCLHGVSTHASCDLDWHDGSQTAERP